MYIHFFDNLYNDNIMTLIHILYYHFSFGKILLFDFIMTY